MATLQPLTSWWPTITLARAFHQSQRSPVDNRLCSALDGRPAVQRLCAAIKVEVISGWLVVRCRKWHAHTKQCCEVSGRSTALVQT